MSDLLSVPLKGSSQVDWIEPLKKLFKTASLEQENLEASLQELNKLRTLVTSAKQLERSQNGADIIARYHDQVKALETRIPLENLKLNFYWEDAFDKGTLFGGKLSTSLPFLRFERTCVLFNLGAFLSQLGAEHQLADSDEEMKIVAKWFQTSSGIFAHLSSSIGVLSTEPLTPDFNPDVLSSLSGLMLAQAQEIFVTKAIKDKMKDSVIAKLCTQAEDMYSDSLLKMTKENPKFKWDQSWLLNVAGKQLAFAGLSQFFQSQACLASKRIGEQIARLNLCIETLMKAQSKMGNTTLFSFYLTEANRLVKEAKKDNDFIYHEQVPDPSNLSAIDKIASARLAKPMNISQQEPLSPNFTDLFSNLKPKEKSSILPKWMKKSKTEEVKSPDTSDNSGVAGESSTEGNPDDSSPLKQALDASAYALGYYVKQYLPGKK